MDDAFFSDPALLRADTQAIMEDKDLFGIRSHIGLMVPPREPRQDLFA